MLTKKGVFEFITTLRLPSFFKKNHLNTT